MNENLLGEGTVERVEGKEIGPAETTFHITEWRTMPMESRD